MAEKKIKSKDMVIAIFCTLLAVLCIVFYFLPAFTIKHRPSVSGDFEIINYSAWEMTKATFSNTKVLGSNMIGLMYIKDTYGFAIMLSGILMPLSIACSITTAVFAYLSWLKNDKFKVFCFLFSLCGMAFATITLISTWFIAIQIKAGDNFDFFYMNIKGSIGYASFVSLILAFVIAIIACAYNYFLDNFDDDEEEEDEEDEEEEEELATANNAPAPKKAAKPVANDEGKFIGTDKPKEEKVKIDINIKTTNSSTKVTTKKPATKTASKSTTTKKTAGKTTKTSK